MLGLDFEAISSHALFIVRDDGLALVGLGSIKQEALVTLGLLVLADTARFGM